MPQDQTLYSLGIWCRYGTPIPDLPQGRPADHGFIAYVNCKGQVPEPGLHGSQIPFIRHIDDNRPWTYALMQSAVGVHESNPLHLTDNLL